MLPSTATLEFRIDTPSENVDGSQNLQSVR